jgi:hypothetical protein
MPFSRCGQTGERMAAALAADLSELIKGGWHDMDDTKTVLLQIL